MKDYEGLSSCHNSRRDCCENCLCPSCQDKGCREAMCRIHKTTTDIMVKSAFPISTCEDFINDHHNICIKGLLRLRNYCRDLYLHMKRDDQ